MKTIQADGPILVRSGIAEACELGHAGLVHLNATLEAFHVPQAKRDEVVAFIQSTKQDIVEEAGTARAAGNK